MHGDKWLGWHNRSAFVKRLEAFHVKSGIVYEYIISLLVANESVTFLVVEPFNRTFHCRYLQIIYSEKSLAKY